MALDRSSNGFGAESDASTVDVEELDLHVAIRRSLLEQGCPGDVGVPSRPARSSDESAPLLHVRRPPSASSGPKLVPCHRWVFVPASGPGRTRTHKYGERAAPRE
ncbi:hypothetical protein D1007_17311 [Hordeum vulgare]|nr:hypothetical protein D1007_17311 [Hordeum vulgare]